MKPADPREADYLRSRVGARLDRASHRRVLGESEMRPVDLVVGDELGEQQLQVPIVQHDHVVEQFAANGGDEALGNAFLPRAAEAGPPVAGAPTPPRRPARSPPAF
jgi:hypothetical protein